MAILAIAFCEKDAFDMQIPQSPDICRRELKPQPQLLRLAPHATNCGKSTLRIVGNPRESRRGVWRLLDTALV